MHRIIVFDFFGVICSEVAPLWLSQRFSAPEATAIKSGLIHQADLGRISQDEMFQQLSVLSHTPANQIKTEWEAIATVDREVVDLIEMIKPRCRLGLLTNAPSEFVRNLLNRENLLRLFEEIVVSSENDCAKPDAAIYQRMLSLLSVNAQEALMIDDNPLNVAGALSVGMDALHYQSCTQLRHFLMVG